MNDGGVSLVYNHSVHDAYSNAGTVEAYVQPPTTHAACCPQLSRFDVYSSLPWRHSIQFEHDFWNPFDALLHAWKLHWSIICDVFQTTMDALRSDSPDIVSDDPFAITRKVFADESSILKHPFVTRCPSHRRVRFSPQVSVLIGLEDELMMSHSSMHITDFVFWIDKPWQKKISAKPSSTNSKSARRKVISPLLEPLSSAASIRERFDDFSFMQVQQCKTSLQSQQEATLVDSIAPLTILHLFMMEQRALQVPLTQLTELSMTRHEVGLAAGIPMTIVKMS